MVAASIMSAIAACSLIGRNLMGIICDKVGARRGLIICLVMITLAITWLLFGREIWMFYCFAVIYGIAYGGIAVIQTLVLAELFGLGYLGIIFGNIMLIGTVGGSFGPPIAGAIFDTSGSYNLAFMLCLAISILAIIISLILLKAKTWSSG